MDELNHGVIVGSGTKSLWLGGAIPYEVVLESGDWTPYAKALLHERQADPLETMACVSFSCNNCMEIQYKFYGLDVNLSDRFLAKMSDTQPNGNYLDKVADTARLLGVVTESQYPNLPKATTWNEYYKAVPQEVINKAVKQPILYEQTSTGIENLKKQLKQSPIQITVPAPHPNHAITLLKITGTTGTVMDHYSQQIHTIPVSSISYALKIVLMKQYMFPVKKVKVVIDNKPSWGVAVITPNMINITLAEDEAEWRSYSQSNPGYGVLTVNPGGATNWDVDSTINM